MNKKYLIAIFAIIIICAAAFALTNSHNMGNVSFSINANALEDRGNLVVDSENSDEHDGYYHSDGADTNAVLVKNGGKLKLANSAVNKTGDTAHQFKRIKRHFCNQCQCIFFKWG